MTIHKGFEPCVENSLYVKGGMFSLLSTPEEILDFLSFLEQYDNIGLLLDLGHLNVASYHLKFPKQVFLEELIKQYRHKIFEIHISRNNSLDDSHDISTIECFEVEYVRKL